MNIKKYQVCVIVCLLLNSGCATTVSRRLGPRELYEGTKTDIAIIISPISPHDPKDTRADLITCLFYSLIPFALLDLPLSFVADTILLPITIPEMRQRQKMMEEMAISPQPITISPESPDGSGR